MKVNVFGAIFGGSGYASHTRQLICALDDAGFDVTIETGLPSPVWDHDPDMTDQLIRLVKKPVQKRAPTIMITQPQFWKHKLADRPEAFYGFLVFEGDRLATGWAEICNDSRITGIFVPSEHTRKAALASGVTKPIHIVPHGVNTDLFKPKEVSKDFAQLVNHETCNFGFFKGWVHGEDDRSGFATLARAYSEEFSADEPVRLLIHINKAYCPQGWNFGAELAKLNLPQGRAKLTYLDGQFAFKDLPNLYNLSDFVVSASKAEAFNLTILEGMACGCIPIVPDNGGEFDYASYGIVYPGGDPIPAFGDLTYEGVSWRQPTVKDLRLALRKAYELWKNKDEYAAFIDIAHATAQKMTWKNTAEQVKALIEHP